MASLRAIESSLTITEAAELANFMYNHHAHESALFIKSLLTYVDFYEMGMTGNTDSEWVSFVNESMNGLKAFEGYINGNEANKNLLKAATSVLALSIAIDKTPNIVYMRINVDNILKTTSFKNTLTAIDLEALAVFTVSLFKFWLAIDQLDATENTRALNRSVTTAVAKTMMDHEWRFLKWMAVIFNEKFKSSMFTVENNSEISIIDVPGEYFETNILANNFVNSNKDNITRVNAL